MLEGLGMVTQAVGYLRVSSKGQLKGPGLDDQQKAVERFAEKNGLEMVRFYKDAKTGTTEERDEFARMLADLIANGVKMAQLPRQGSSFAGLRAEFYDPNGIGIELRQWLEGDTFNNANWQPVRQDVTRTA